MTSTILSHEWRLLRRAPATWLALGLLAAAVLFGASNGGRWADFQRQTLADARAYEDALWGDLAGRAAAPDGAWPDPTSAASVGMFNGRYATLPPAPLAPLAVGQSDVAPYALYVSGMNLASTHTKAAEELGNPQAYVTGRFDTAFALVVVLPLVLLALLFDVVSGERERGTLGLVLSQPVRPGVLVWAKAGLRWALVVGVAWASVLAGLALVGADLGAAPGGLAVALLAVALYAAVWTALAVWAGTWGRPSATNALALAAAWVAVVVVVPGLIGVASGALAPVPSRTALIEAQRAADSHFSARAADLLVAYYDANPGAQPDGLDPTAYDFPLYYTARQEAMHDTLAPLVRRYDDALAAQERLAGRLAVLSPAALLQAALAAVAGTDHARHADYLRQVEAFHAAHRGFFAPRAFRQVALTAADYEAMPTFAFREPGGATSRTAWPLAAMLGLAVALAALAAPGLRRLTTP